MLVSTTDPIQLRTNTGPDLLLTFEQKFHHGPHPDYPGDHKVFTDSYSYRVRYSEVAEGALFAWHWHPDQRPESHIHIGAPHATATDLHKRHVPAGRVSFEEILIFLIDEMNVHPIRDTYESDLHDSLTRFEHFRSWSGSRKGSGSV